DPQPTGLSHQPMRSVTDIIDGKPQLIAYELGGKLYSIKQTLELKPTFAEARDPENEELVNVVFTTPPSAKWDNYKPCLVMPEDWNNFLTNGAPLTGVWESKFNDPSQRLSLGPAKGAGGFVDASTSDCGGAS